MKRSRLSFFSIGTFLLVTLGLLLQPFAAQAANHLSARHSLQLVWQNARNAGAYRFAADVTQLTVPEATIMNVGRQARRDAVHLEGTTSPDAQSLDFTLWSDGGSILDAESGLQVRIREDKATARKGNGAWQEINDFSGLFAPGGDFMAYLAAASDIMANPEHDKYTFSVDGPQFAAYIRDALQQQLVASGELPPGMDLDLPEQYRDMTGTGELWVDSRGLPLRQTLNLELPDEHGARIAAEVDVSFSGFAKAVAPKPATRSASSHLRQIASTVAFAGATLSFVALTIVCRQARKVYAALVILVLLSQIATPLIQSTRAVAFTRAQAVKAAEQAELAEESEMVAALTRAEQELANESIAPGAALAALQNDKGLDTDRDGLTDVTEILTGHDLFKADASVTRSTSLPELNTAPTQEDGTDSDNDGLTDYVEGILGTSAELADTDGDLLDDATEVAGFTFAGRTWYTDPLEADTNEDGKGDGQQWDANNDGTVDDTDSDGIPDVFDMDDDNDGVPDSLDMAVYQRSPETFTASSPFLLNVENLTADKITYVEFQIRPTNPDHLWYAYNVLDWPIDKEGQVQDGDGKTFYDVNPNSDPSPNNNGDLKLVPMLEVVVPEAGNLPDSALLRNYGISTMPADQGEITHYVPLQLVTEEEGNSHVAFYAKMLYDPQVAWGAPHRIRVVWLVQTLLDTCETYKDGACIAYSAHNQEQPIHTYGEEWYLTGLSVREDHGVETAIIYEHPDDDADLNRDSTLIRLAYAVENTLLAGRVEANGSRFTLQNLTGRLTYVPTTQAEIEQRFGITETLGVVTATYAHQDEALMTLAMTGTTQVLDGTFTPHWSADAPITPTLMIVQEQKARRLGLDELQAGSGTASIRWDGTQLTADFDPALVEQMTTALMSWAPYGYNAGAGRWESAPIETYWNELARRYEGELYDPDPDIALGQLTMAQILYVAINKGIVSPVQVGDNVLQRDWVIGDKPIAASLATATGSAIRFGVNKWLMNGYFNRSLAHKSLGILMKQQRFTSRNLTQPMTMLKQLLGRFKGWWKSLSTLSKGLVAVAAVAAVGALAVGLYYLSRSFAAGDPVTRVAVAVVVGVVATALMVVVPLMQVADFVKVMASVKNISQSAALAKSLTKTSEITGTSSKAGVVGLVISIGITWGVFIYALASSDIPFGSIAFNQLLAQTIAATIVAIIMFALSLTIVGAIIVAIVAIIDIILLILGCDWSITGFVTEAIADALYHFELLVDTDVDVGQFDMQLVNENAGMVSSNQMRVSAAITTTATHKNPSDIRLYPYLPLFYTTNNLKKTAFTYVFTTTAISVTTGINEIRDIWDVDYDHEFWTKDLYKGTAVQHPAEVFPMAAGINTYLPIYLNTGYALPVAQCWSIPVLFGLPTISVCYNDDIDGSTSADMTDAIALDILPPTLDEFYALSWANSLVFTHQRDHDGDGLLNAYFGGNDPNDETWDSDNDGLSDAYELQMRALGWDQGGGAFVALKLDTDNDGLTDAQEVSLGTNPAKRDSDGDGLDDDEEIYHRDLTDSNSNGDTLEWIGGWTLTHVYTDTGNTQHTLSAHVVSDPLLIDPDGDGMGDMMERTLNAMAPDLYPFNPLAVNDNPLGFTFTLSDEDGIVKPGDSFVVTTTIANNLAVTLFTSGTLTTQMPTQLGGQTISDKFNLAPDYTASLTSSVTVAAGDTDTAVINTGAEGRLHDGDVRIRWDWDPAWNTTSGRDTATTTAYPWYTAVAPAYTSSGVGYALASVEGDNAYNSLSTNFIDNASNSGVRLRLAGTSIGGSNLASVEPRPTSPGLIDTRAAVACAENTGKCAVLWGDSQYQSHAEVRITELTCHTEKDAGSHGEYYIKFNGSTVWGEKDFASGTTRSINYFNDYTTSATLKIYEEDDWPNGDDYVGQATTYALQPGAHSHYINDDDGNMTIRWYAIPNYSNAVYASVFSSTGTRQCTPVAVGSRSKTTPGTASSNSTHTELNNHTFQTPAVASDGTNFVAVWRESDGLKANRLTSACGVGSKQSLSTGTRNNASYWPDIVWIGDRYLIVYEYHYSGTDYDVKMITLNSSGQQIGSVTNIAVTGGMETKPRVAYDPINRRALIVYGAGSSIKARLVTGTRPGSEFTIATGLSNLAEVDVAYEPTHGGWMVAWSRHQSPSTLYALPLDAEGNPLLAAGDGEDKLAAETMPLSYGLSTFSVACNPSVSDSSTAECALAANPVRPVGSTTKRPITLDQVSLRSIQPWLGTFSLSESTSIQIDADVPTATFTSLTDGQKFSAQDALVIGGDAFDNQGIAAVWVDTGYGYELASGHASWAYTWDLTGYSDGAHTLKVKAVDVAGNDGPEETITVTLDHTPPNALNAGITAGTIVSATTSGEDRWTVALTGTVNDTTSEVAGVEASISPYGVGWQPVTMTSPTSWTMDYPLAAFDDAGVPLANPTGGYTLTLRATDALSNTTAPDDMPQITFSIDNQPPTATLDSVETGGSAITQTALLGGNLTDGGAVAAGVAELEIAITPANQTDQVWESVDTLDSPNAASSTWSHQVPTGLEGLYRIDLRGTDVLGNRNDDQATWQKWNGEIDTQAPRAAITVTYRGAGSAMETVYSGFAQDFNLDEGQLSFPCPVQAADRGYYADDWWTEVTTDTGRLYTLRPTCVVPGQITEPASIRACDTYGRCTVVEATLPTVFSLPAPLRLAAVGLRPLAAPGYTPPAIASTILTPTHESVLGTLDPVTLHVGAHAADGLKTVTLTGSDGTLTHTTWTTSPVDAAWSVPWTPPSEGRFRFSTLAQDSHDALQTQLQPITLTVDTTPPQVTLPTTPITEARRLSYGRVLYTLTATDTVGIEQVLISDDEIHWGTARPEGDIWRYPWNLGTEPDGGVYTVTVRVLDRARVVTHTQPVVVDLAPPAPVTTTLSYTGLLASGVLSDEQVIREAYPTLALTWTASSDGSGIARYLAGWLPEEIPDTTQLGPFLPTQDFTATMTAGEAEIWYGHVVAEDTVGNTTLNTAGPIIVDSPLTPDYIEDLSRHGWMESGCAQVAVDHDTPNGTQRLYTSWDTASLRLTYTGANWDADGDLLIAFDTGPGGTPALFNPYGQGAEIALPVTPAPMGADYVVWISDNDVARLYVWTGSWTEVRWLTTDHFRFENTGSMTRTDLRLPFTDLGITDPDTASLRLFAAASEDSRLRVWSTLPDNNPVNSTWATVATAHPYADYAFTMTRALHWPSLGTGICPNAAWAPDTNLQADLVSTPAASSLGYLDDALAGRAEPDAWLDQDGDGALDATLNGLESGVTLGDGDHVTYTLTFSNTGIGLAPGAVVSLTTHGAVDLWGGTPQVHTLSGVSGSLIVTGTIHPEPGDQSAELLASVGDAARGTYDWLWAHHLVDTMPPEGLIIEPPLSYVKAYTNTITGRVGDPSGVPTLTLSIQPDAGGSPTLVTCADPTPFDGAWSCSWNAGTLNNGATFSLSARATDRHGNTSAWTTAQTMTADTNPPTAAFAAETESNLSDDLISAAEATLKGSIIDNYAAKSARLCAAAAGTSLEQATCTTVDTTPPGSGSGAWQATVPLIDEGDGTWQTLYLQGIDAAGNVSTVINRTAQVDIIAPAITVAHAAQGTVLGLPTEILSGTINDGMALDISKLLVAVTQPDGNTISVAPSLAGNQWSCTRMFDTLGKYLVALTAYDTAGNASQVGPYTMVVAQGDAVADLQVTTTTDTDPAITGRQLTYNIHISNAGPAAAPGTVLDVDLPAETGIFSLPTSCIETTAHHIRCNLGTLADQESSTLDITVAVPLTTTGNLQSVAEVIGEKTDFTPDDALSRHTVPTYQPVTGLGMTAQAPIALGDMRVFSASVATGSQVAYVWDFGNGITTTGQVVSYTYPATGRFTAIVTATNAVSTEDASTPIIVDVPVAAPIFLEGFEVVTATLPTGWQRYTAYDLNDDYDWTLNEDPSYTRTGLASVFHDDEYGGEQSWLVTPPLDLQTNSQLQFWQFQRYPDHYIDHSIWVSADSTNPKDEDYVQVTELGPGPSGTWEQQSLDIGEFAGQPVQIAWRYQGESADEWAIDDVVVTADLLIDHSGPVAVNTETSLSAVVARGTNIEYVWDLGDGTTATGATLSHTYTSPGTYSVVVTAANPINTVTATAQIDVQRAIIGLNATSDDITRLSQPSHLTATITSGDAVSYTWDLGDGTTATGPHISHIYPDAGVYTATVTAANAVSAISTTTSLIVQESVAGLDVHTDSVQPLGIQTVLSATVTAGTDLAYNWDLGDGTHQTGAVVTHTYPSIGAYTATVTASNAVSSQQAQTTIEIKDLVYGLTVDASTPTPLGDVTSLTATVAGGSGTVISWGFHDGTTATGSIVTHTYATAGTYVVTATAANALNAVSTTTEVQVLTPIADLTIEAPSLTETDAAVVLSATLTAGDDVAYTWDLGDGATATGSTCTHAYSTSGTYTVTITANNSVSSQTQSTRIEVQAPISGLTASGIETTTVGVTATLSAAIAGGTAPDFVWSLGDGTIASGAIITHVYATTGTYTAVVTATNKVSSQTADLVIVVQSPITGLDVHNDSPSALESMTTLTTTTSSGSDVSYTWDLGDGATGTGAVIRHIYPAATAYTAIVTASNAVDSQTTQTTVTILAPVTGLSVTNSGVTRLESPAAFTATVTSGSAPLFTWAFDDGTTAAGPVVTHTFAQSGLHTTTVTATNAVSAITATTQIEVQAPLSSLRATNSGITALGNATTLLAEAVGQGDIRYTWDFGDGTTGTGSSEQHTYPTAGTYTAIITAANAVSAISTTTDVVVQAPVAELLATSSGLAPLTAPATFTATVASGSDLAYTWDFGDGTGTIGSAAETGQVVTHTYANVGTYTAVVTAENAISTMSTKTAIEVKDLVHGLTATNDSPSEVDAITVLTATVAGGSDVSYTWNLGDGTTAEGPVVAHAYTDAGIYTATVTATNPINGISTTSEVTVQAPVTGLVATHAATTDEDITKLGAITTLSVTLTGGTDPVFNWDLGDGTTATGTGVTHTYAAAGTYTATVTCANAVSSAASTTIVTVQAPVAGLRVTGDGPALLGTPTALSVRVTGGTDLTYAWSLGDGTTAAGTRVIHTYDAPGRYAAVVTASNAVDVVSATTTTIVQAPISGLQLHESGPTALGDTTTLTASVSEGTDITFTWALGDGTSTTGRTVTHVYDRPATFRVTVTATNMVDSAMKQNETLVETPLSGLVALQNGPTILGEPTTLSATLATGTHPTFFWDLGNGEIRHGAVITHTWPAIGTHTATVTATNAVGAITSTVTTHVALPAGIPILEEGFEESANTFPPAGWQLLGDLPSSINWQSTSARAYTGNFSAFHNDDFGEQEAWLVMPPVTPGPGSALIFWQSENYTPSYHQHRVLLSSGSPYPKDGDYHVIYEDVGPEDTWERVEVDLTSYAGQQVFIAFYYAGTYADEWYVDDVQVTAVLTASNDGPTRLGETTTLTANLPTGSGMTYRWFFGNGVQKTGRVITHTFAAPGHYPIGVRASNDVSFVTAATEVLVQAQIYLPTILHQRQMK